MPAAGTGTFLEPASAVGTAVHLAGARAKPAQPTPTASHGRGRETWATGLGTECVRPTGAGLIIAPGQAETAGATLTVLRRRLAGARRSAERTGSRRFVEAVSTGRRFFGTVEAVGAGLLFGVILLRDLVPAVHHALTDLLQVGDSLVCLGRANLGVKVSSAEQQTNGRSQRPRHHRLHYRSYYRFHIARSVIQSTLR